MSRSLKKGPHVDYKLYLKVEKQEAAGENKPIKISASLHHRAGIHRSHLPGAQRPCVHRCLRRRRHGGTQTRRVLTLPHVPWSHQQEGGPEGTLIVLRG